MTASPTPTRFDLADALAAFADTSHTDLVNPDQVDTGDLTSTATQLLDIAHELHLAYLAAGCPDPATATDLFSLNVEPAHIAAFTQRGVTDFDEMLDIADLVPHPDEFMLWSAAGFITAADIEQAQTAGLDAETAYRFARVGVRGIHPILDHFENGTSPDDIDPRTGRPIRPTGPHI